MEKQYDDVYAHTCVFFYLVKLYAIYQMLLSVDDAVYNEVICL